MRAGRLTSVFAYREFRLLWASQLASETGDFISRVALAGLLYQETGSVALSAAGTIATVLPWAAGPFLTARLDFLPLRTIMICSDAIRMVVFATLALGLPTMATLVLAFAAGLCTPPFEAARTAVLIEAVPAPESYVISRVVSVLTFQTTSMVGLLLGGLALTQLGPRGALLIDAATYGVSLVCVVFMRVGRGAPDRVGVAENLRRGFRAVFGDALVRRAALLPVWGFAGALAAEALLVGWAGEHGRLPLVGLLAATVPAATIATSAIITRFLDARVPRLLRAAHWLSIGGTAVAVVGFSLPRNLATDLLAMVGLGVAFAAIAPLTSVVGLRVPQGEQNHAFAVLGATLRLGDAAAVGVGAALTAYLGVNTALICLNVVCLALLLLGLLRMPRVTDAEPLTPVQASPDA